MENMIEQLLFIYVVIIVVFLFICFLIIRNATRANKNIELQERAIQLQESNLRLQQIQMQLLVRISEALKVPEDLIDKAVNR